MKTVLTIAGFDPSGGAGVPADLRTFLDMGVRGLAVVTALTAQNEKRFFSLNPVSPKTLREQLQAVSAIKIDAVKIGMLGTKENVLTVYRFLKRKKIPIVVLDPVFRSSTGAPLLEPEGIVALKKLLIPWATVVTPNLDEVEILTGRKVRSLEAMRSAASFLYKSCKGVKAVLIKGGHLKGETTDLLYDGRKTCVLTGKRLPDISLHGSGCLLSSAIAAGLVQGITLQTSARRAKNFVIGCMRRSAVM